MPVRRSTIVRLPHLLVLLLVLASANETLARSTPSQPHAHEGSSNAHLATRRRRRSDQQQQGTALLQPEVKAKASSRGATRRRRRSQAGGVSPAVGNSFISLRAPVRKVAVFSSNRDETIRSIPTPLNDSGHSIAAANVSFGPSGNVSNATLHSAQQREVHETTGASSLAMNQTGVSNVVSEKTILDSVGMRAASSWNTTITNFTSNSPLTQGSRAWWLTQNSVVCIMTLLACAVVLYLALVVVRNWRHRNLLCSVEAKFCRAHEYFLGQQGDMELCLCCIEPMASSSEDSVTFICGHGFHTACVNDWNKRHSRDGEPADCIACPSHCPICVGQSCSARCDEEMTVGESSDTGHQETAPEPATTSSVPALGAATNVGTASSAHRESASECAWLFAMHCLCEKYPDVMTKDHLKRFSALPTAALMSDIRFKTQKSSSQLQSLFG